MTKYIIKLPNGTEISSGADTVNAIASTTLTTATNSGTDLTLGSVCAAMVECTLITPGAGLAITAGDEITLYTENDSGSRTKVGLFTVEMPTHPSANRTKVTAYDRVAQLEKELDMDTILPDDTTLLEFVNRISQACGLSFDAGTMPQFMRTFTVRKFSQSPVTGRQLMRWAAEICSRFCRANADGVIEFGWYTQAPVSIGTSGDNYYFSGSLSYENYTVAPVEAVQLRLAEGENGYLWPDVETGANSYIISGNPLLLAHGTSDIVQTVLNDIRSHLSETYTGCTPCKVSVPDYLDVQAGDRVSITDANGNTITTYVMTRTQSGQKATLECTGSPRRDSASAVAEADGARPQNGKDGVGVSAVQEQYYRSTSTTGLSGGSWSETYPGWVSGTYIWTRTVIEYTDGTAHTTTPICVSGTNGKDGVNGTNGTNGKDGEDGKDGVGIQAVDVEYYLSNSSTALSGGSWQSTVPTITEGKYLWSRDKVTYTSGTVKYTDAFCVSKAMEESAGPLVDALDEKLNQEEVFKRLTDDGKLQGVYMQDGKIYINASYIKTGELLADLIKAGKITSKNDAGGYFVIDLETGEIKSTANEVDETGVKLETSISNGKIKVKNANTGITLHEMTTENGYAEYRQESAGFDGQGNYSTYALRVKTLSNATSIMYGRDTGQKDPDGYPVYDDALQVIAFADGDVSIGGLSDFDKTNPAYNLRATPKAYVDRTVEEAVTALANDIADNKFSYIKMTLLWENASKTSAFPAQTLDLNLQQYDAYIIIARHATGVGGAVSGINKTGYSIRLTSVGSDPAGYYDENIRTATYSNGSIKFGDAKHNGVVSNGVVIPIFIYGIRGVENY